MFGHFPTFLLAMSLYLCCGVGVAALAMAHVHAHARHDLDFARLERDNLHRNLAAILPQVGVVIAWPVAVAYALFRIWRDNMRLARFSAV